MSKELFINGGTKTRLKPFEYISPIGFEEIQAATEVLKSKALSGFYKDFMGGSKVQEFEKAFADYLGVQYAISVNSGTSALHIALLAAGISAGDEVIVPPFTFTATVASVLMANATPVFADIDPETLCMNLNQIKSKITSKTKAIIPVHIYGKVADLDGIRDLIKDKGIVLIEDACQAPGCIYKGKKVGSIGDCGIFSFVETKNIVIGEGGMVTTNNDEIAEKCRLIRNHGEAWVKGKPRQYISQTLGYNFRLTEIPAAIGIEQIKKLDALNEFRSKNAAYLYEQFKTIDGLRVIPFGTNEICHIFPVFFNETKMGISKKRFMEAVTAEGIGVTAGYPHPMYKFPIFETFDRKDCPVAEKVCEELITIRQIYAPYNVSDMKDVIVAFKKVIEQRQTL